MSRATWVVVLALCALAAVAVPLLGYSLPPCLGDLEGHISPVCLARWDAAMPLFPQRFVYFLGVPLSAGVTFLALTGGVVVYVWARRLRRRSGA